VIGWFGPGWGNRGSLTSPEGDKLP
jgi:hypothetical protein